MNADSGGCPATRLCRTSDAPTECLKWVLASHPVPKYAHCPIQSVLVWVKQQAPAPLIKQQAPACTVPGGTGSINSKDAPDVGGGSSSERQGRQQHSRLTHSLNSHRYAVNAGQPSTTTTQSSNTRYLFGMRPVAAGWKGLLAHRQAVGPCDRTPKEGTNPSHQPCCCC